jgi:hypothetical protein
MTTSFNIIIQQLSCNKYHVDCLFSSLKKVISQTFILFTSQRFYFLSIQLYQKHKLTQPEKLKKFSLIFLTNVILPTTIFMSSVSVLIFQKFNKDMSCYSLWRTLCL